MRISLGLGLGLGLGWRAAEAGVAGAVEKVDDLFELGDSEAGDFGAVEVVEIEIINVVVKRRRRRKETNEMLHAL